MMNDYAVRIVLAAIGLGVLGLLTLAWWAWATKLKPWLDVRLTAAQRELIDRFARDGYAWVEKNFVGTGREKFEQACEWLSIKLGRIGIKIPAEEIEAAVQKAWEDFNANKQPAKVIAPTVTVNMSQLAGKAQTEEIVKQIEVGMQEAFQSAEERVVDPKS